MKTAALWLFIFLWPAAALCAEDAVSPPAGEESPEAEEGAVRLKEEAVGVIEGDQKVEVEGGLLTVGIKDAEFGKVLEEIAGKAGFEAEIDRSSYTKRLNTSFERVGIERGVLRLLTLANEKNYFIYYDSEGMISKIEVYGQTVPPPPKKVAPEKRQKQRPSRPSVVAPPPPPLQIQPYPEDFGEGEAPLYEEAPYGTPEVPYIPPSQEPVYIPPAPSR